jgi:hypothetical protein
MQSLRSSDLIFNTFSEYIDFLGVDSKKVGVALWKESPMHFACFVDEVSQIKSWDRNGFALETKVVVSDDYGLSMETLPHFFTILHEGVLQVSPLAMWENFASPVVNVGCTPVSDLPFSRAISYLEGRYSKERVSLIWKDSFFLNSRQFSVSEMQRVFDVIQAFCIDIEGVGRDRFADRSCILFGANVDRVKRLLKGDVKRRSNLNRVLKLEKQEFLYQFSSCTCDKVSCDCPEFVVLRRGNSLHLSLVSGNFAQKNSQIAFARQQFKKNDKDAYGRFERLVRLRCSSKRDRQEEWNFDLINSRKIRQNYNIILEENQTVLQGKTDKTKTIILVSTMPSLDERISQLVDGLFEVDIEKSVSTFFANQQMRTQWVEFSFVSVLSRFVSLTWEELKREVRAISSSEIEDSLLSEIMSRLLKSRSIEKESFVILGVVGDQYSLVSRSEHFEPLRESAERLLVCHSVATSIYSVLAYYEFSKKSDSFLRSFALWLFLKIRAKESRIFIRDGFYWMAVSSPVQVFPLVHVEMASPEKVVLKLPGAPAIEVLEWMEWREEDGSYHQSFFRIVPSGGPHRYIITHTKKGKIWLCCVVRPETKDLVAKMVQIHGKRDETWQEVQAKAVTLMDEMVKKEVVEASIEEKLVVIEKKKQLFEDEFPPCKTCGYVACRCSFEQSDDDDDPHWCTVCGYDLCTCERDEESLDSGFEPWCAKCEGRDCDCPQDQKNDSDHESDNEIRIWCPVCESADCDCGAQDD